MSALSLLIFIFAGSADTLMLQSRLHVTILQNVSMEGDFRGQWSPDHPRQSPTLGVEQKLQEESKNHAFIVSAEKNEIMALHTKRMRKEEHVTLKKEGELSVDERHGENEKKESPEKHEKKPVEKTIGELIVTGVYKAGDKEHVLEKHTFDDSKKYSNGGEALASDDGIHPSGTPPTVSQIHHMQSSHPVSPLDYILPTTLSSLVTNTQSDTKNHKTRAKKTKVPKNRKNMKKLKEKKQELTSAPYFPYFTDDYCPPDCACYGRVVQCSDKDLEKIPYGIPYNSRYILLMNNRINTVPLDLLSEYLFMEFLVLSNNCLSESSTEGVFEGIQSLKRLYLDRNLFQSIPMDLPASLEELRLDGNKVSVMSEAAWSRCPGLMILSLSNNSLGGVLSMMPPGVLSPLVSLRTLSLSHNQLTSVPLHLPLSLQELYLRGNLFQHFQNGVFLGRAELQVLDLSLNRLTNKGLGKLALMNVTRLESLNLEGNFLKQVPRYLPRSLKTLNLEGNSISSISKTAFLSLPHLEHLGLGRNKINRVAPGAFRMLPFLHQLDLSYNALRQVPRRLPPWLVSITMTKNKIQTITRDAFCWTGHGEIPSRLVRVHLENNLIDLGSLDSNAFNCLRGYQVVQF